MSVPQTKLPESWRLWIMVWRSGSIPRRSWATAAAQDENDAFGPLFRYISGRPKGEKIEMTTPVVTPAPPANAESAPGEGEKIEMTAPVVTADTEEGLSMGFIMPERYDIQTIPRPTSSNVEIS